MRIQSSMKNSKIYPNFEILRKAKEYVWKHKKRTTHRENILRPFLESPRLTLSNSKLFRRIWHFLQPERYSSIFTEKRDIFTLIPFWLQKGIKIHNFVDANMIFRKYGP